MSELDNLSVSEIHEMIVKGEVSKKAVADHFDIAYQAFLRYWTRTESLEKVIFLDETVVFRDGNPAQFYTIGNVTGTAKGWGNVLGCSDTHFRKIVKMYPKGSRAIYKHEFKRSRVYGGNKEWIKMKDIPRNLHLLTLPGTWERQWI